MGSPKADLEWHGSTLLRRVTGIAARGCGGPVLVVRAPGQHLPLLAPGVDVVEDLVGGLGPLQGLATGLAALRGSAETAFVAATDLPFLQVAFVRRILAAIGAADVAVPRLHGHLQPLAAAYRTALAPLAQALVEEGRRRATDLFDRADGVELDEAALLTDTDLARRDPSLASVRGCNDVTAYRLARAEPPPTVLVRGVGLMRAASLGAVAAERGLELGDLGPVTLNGAATEVDAEVPLCAGDVLDLGWPESWGPGW
jgi:molybdopterin-guanine dinucleotide biosynthesis protein A